MSDTRVHITTLLRDFETTFNNPRMPEHARNEFFDRFYGTLDTRTTVSTIVNGHSSTTLLSTLRSTLQHVSESSDDPWVKNVVWNPVVAVLLTNYQRLLRSSDTEDLSSRFGEMSTSAQPGSNLGTSAKPKIVANHGEPSQKKGTKPPKAQSTSVDKQPSTPRSSVISDQLAISIRAEKTKGPWFQNLKHVKCNKEQCSFCENLWYALHLTKCDEIRCHTTGKLCHPAGWSAHVLPTMWLAAKRDHDAGKDFPGLEAYLLRKPVRESSREQLPGTKESDRPGSPSYAEIVRKRRMSVESVDSPKTPRMNETSLEDSDYEALIQGADWTSVLT